MDHTLYFDYVYRLCSSLAPNAVTLSYRVRGAAMAFDSVLPLLPGAPQLSLSPRPLTADVAASSPRRRVPPRGRLLSP
ncbi:hypothetical protein ACI65C_002272 [Semiaphis heraclei]